MNNNKWLSLLIMLMCFNLSVSAQKKDSVFAEAKLNKATLYYGSGADLYHSCKATLTAGVQDIVINNVAIEPDMNTIQLSCPENVTILSYTHQVFEQKIPAKINPQIIKWKDSIKGIEKQTVLINRDMEIQRSNIRRINDLINNNVTSRENKNISSDELIKLSNFYTDKLSGLENKIYQLEDQKNTLNERIRSLQEKIKELSGDEWQDKTKITGRLILHVLSDISGSMNFECNYFSRNAGWIPNYDIRVKSNDNTLKLNYKALVSQNTGMDWDHVKLTLSTGTPIQGNQMPLLSPIYLQLYVPVLYERVNAISAMKSMAAPQIAEAKLEYDGATGSGKDQYKENNDVSNYMTLNESQLNTNYEINLPYDIPSDGKAYTVNIKEEKLNAVYEHEAVPKLDQDAFFTALIGSWNELNLLPGEANIIMDNIYAGKTYINAYTTEDTMKISLGRDHSISINRKLAKEFNSVKRRESKIETYTYEITVKNNKKEKINLQMKDQYPVSKVKEVEVSLQDDGQAEVNAETGILSWKLSLNPGEIKKIRFKYEVKYPKDKTLIETR